MPIFKHQKLKALGPKAVGQLRQHKLLTAVSALLVLVFCLGSFPFKARAATVTWDGGGADNNWSTCANWTTDTCPTSADTAQFNATSTKNSTVDSGFGSTIGSINLNSGYTGTLTLARSLSVTGSYSQAAGSFTADSQTLDMNSTFTLTAGTFTASSGSTTLAGAMTISGSPTFNHNSGTFTFDGATNASLTCNNVTFNLVTFAHSGANTKTVNSSCSLPLGSNPTIGTDASADLTLNGTLTGTGTLTVGTQNGGNLLTLNSGSTLSGFGGLNAGALTLSGATYNFGSYSPFDINGAFILSSGAAFTAPSGTATFASSFTINSGTTFTHNSGTVTFDGANAVTIACNNTTFNLVTFAHTGSTIKTVAADCSLPLGNSPTIGADANADITLSGTLTGTGTLTIGTQASTNALTLNSTAALSGFTGLRAGNFVPNGATVDFSSYTTIFTVSSIYNQTGGTITVPSGADFNSTFTLASSGVFNAPAGNVFFASSFTLNSGTTFNANGGTVTFDGNSSVTLACNNTTFNLVVFAHTAGNKTVNSTCSMPLGNNPSFGSSTAGLVLNGTLSGTGIITFPGSGTRTLNAGSSFSGFDGIVTNGGTITISGATYDWGAYTTANINGHFILSSGAVFTAPAGTMHVEFNFTVGSGTTFNANGGTLDFDGTNAGTIACDSAIFHLVTFTHSAQNKTINSDCNLPLGNNPTFASGTGGLVLNGTLSGSGTITFGGSGTRNFNAGSAITAFSGLVTNGGFFSMGGANYDWSSYNPVDINGHFSMGSGSTLTAPTGTMSVAFNFTIGAGNTFNANGGTLTFDGSAGATIACGNAVFNLVTFVHTDSTKTVNSDCNLPLGNNPTVGVGTTPDLTLNGTLSGGGTLTIGSQNASNVFTINSTGILTGFSGLATGVLNLTGANLNAATYDPFDINGNFTLSSSGVFIAPVGDATFGSAFTLNSGTTFNANGGTVTFDGTGSADISCNNTVFNLVVFNHIASGGNRNVNSDCSLPLGNDPYSPAKISLLGGVLSGSGTLTIEPFTSGVLLFIKDGAQLSGFDGLHTKTLTIDNTTANFGSYTALELESELTLRNGAVFTAPATTMSVAGIITVNSGTTFTHNNGTVVLDGTDQTIIGTLTFHNLTKTVNSAATLTFPAAITTTIEGDLTLKGASGELLSLVSSSPGTQWEINPQSNRDVDYVAVADSNNLNAQIIIACNSQDDGNNDGWSFNPVNDCDSTAPTTPGQPLSATPTTDTTPTWMWTASTDADSGLTNPAYSVQWSKDSTFSSGVGNDTTNTNSYTHNTALTTGTWYFRVRATDNSGNDSAWSSNGSVVIQSAGGSGGGTGGSGGGSSSNTSGSTVPTVGSDIALSDESTTKDKPKATNGTKTSTPTVLGLTQTNQPSQSTSNLTRFLAWLLGILILGGGILLAAARRRRKNRVGLPAPPLRLSAPVVSSKNSRSVNKTQQSANLKSEIQPKQTQNSDDPFNQS